MKKSFVLVLLTAAVFSLAVNSAKGKTLSSLFQTEGQKIQRGAYLVKIMDCSACHTPMRMGPNGPEPDMSRYLSGHPEGLAMPPYKDASGAWVWAGAGTNTAFAGPWGVTYAANLTPDEGTGFHVWTLDMFKKAMKEGKHMGAGRPIMPPMPWPAYAQATDEDLEAVFAYLKSLQPIKNQVPDWQAPE